MDYVRAAAGVDQRVDTRLPTGGAAKIEAGGARRGHRRLGGLAIVTTVNGAQRHEMFSAG